MVTRNIRRFAATAFICRSLCVLCLMHLQSACGDSVREMTVNVGKTIEITSSKRYCWYPTVHRFSTGEILVTMRMSPDEVHPEGEFSAYCVSRDGGQTWSQRYTLGAGANIDAAYTQVGPADGTLLSLSAGYGSPIAFPPGQAQDFHVSVTRFSRGGMEVNQIRDALLRLRAPVQLEPMMLFDLGAKDTSKLETAPEVTPFGAIIDGLNGDLLTTAYCKEEKDGTQQVVLLRSRDGGKAWDEWGVIAGLAVNEKPTTWMGDEGPNETSIVRLADKRLYAVFRTGGNALLGQTWSSDDGRTWTQPVPIGFKGVSPHLRMLSNGVLVCTTGRPGPVSIFSSADGQGEHWSHGTELFRGRSTCYSDVVELEPGRLLVVYDGVPYGPHQIPYSDRGAKNTIYGTFVGIR
jgi:photosystem II stability/assembly factor-like uncharacterized protein